MGTSVQSEVVIAGAGGAGDAAAFALRENGFDGTIALIGADPHRPYDRPYLSKEYLRDEIPTERVFLHAPVEYERQHIELLIPQRVVEVSRGDKTVVLDDGRRLQFKTLLLATGAVPRWPPDVPRLSNTFTLRTLDDDEALKQTLMETRRLMLLGAGFIGAEVAASARVKGKEVLMVEHGPVPLGRALGRDMGEIYARIHTSHGIDLRTNTTVARWLTDRERVIGVELSDGSREEIDAVLVAVGVEADVELARDLGLELGQGGVLVDEALLAAPDIFCGGTSRLTCIPCSDATYGWNTGRWRRSKVLLAEPPWPVSPSPTRSCRGSGLTSTT